MLPHGHSDSKCMHMPQCEDEAEINFINAVGSGGLDSASKASHESGPSFSYHKHRSLGQLVLLPSTGGACLCKTQPPAFGEAKGTLAYTATGAGDEGSGSVAFNNHCSPQPRSC